MRSIGISKVCVHAEDHVISVSMEIIPPEDEAAAFIHETNSADVLAESWSISRPDLAAIAPSGAAARVDFYAHGTQPYDRDAFVAQEGDVLCLVSPAGRDPKGDRAGRCYD